MIKEITDNEKDCGFENEHGWFRYRACAIIIEDNKVLMAKNDSNSYYYSVGGAVKQNETSEEAVLREVIEETGIAYEIDRLIFIHENLFMGDDGKMFDKIRPCHEIAFYYLMKPKGIKIFDKTSYNMYGVEENVSWVDLDEYEKLEAYPAWLSKEIKNIFNEVKHIVERR